MAKVMGAVAAPASRRFVFDEPEAVPAVATPAAATPAAATPAAATPAAATPTSAAAAAPASGLTSSAGAKPAARDLIAMWADVVSEAYLATIISGMGAKGASVFPLLYKADVDHDLKSMTCHGLERIRGYVELAAAPNPRDYLAELFDDSRSQLGRATAKLVAEAASWGALSDPPAALGAVAKALLKVRDLAAKGQPGATVLARRELAEELGALGATVVFQ